MIGGIAGVFYRKGENKEAEAKIHVQKAIELLGPEGSDRSILPVFNSVVFARMSFSFYHSSDSRNHFPIIHNCAITANSLLANKLELAKSLNVSASIEDAEIILIAYLEWGKECLHHLEGKFSFAIWDENKKELFCAKSPTGMSDFVYYLDDNRFTFGTEIKAVIEILGFTPPIDKEFIAEHIDGIKGNIYSTTYQDIKHIPPGFAISITKDSFQEWCYWQPGEANEIRYKNDSDYVEAANELLDTVLQGYINTGLAISLQMGGGMNSSLLASSLTRLQKHSLTAVSYILPEGYSGDLKDEREYTDALKGYLNLDLHYVNEPNFPDPFDEDIERKMMQQDSPIVNPVGSDHYHVYGKMKQLGIQLCMTTGFKSLDWSGGELLPELMIQGRYLKAWNVAQKSNQSFLRRGIVPVLPSFVMENYHSFKGKKGKTYLTHLEILKEFNIISKEKLNRHYFLGKYPSYSKINDQLRYIRMRLYGGKKYISAQEYRYNFAMVNPMMDRRLIDFSLSIPREQHCLNGEPRSLLKRMLEGKVPAQIYEKPMKMSYPADMRDRWLNTKPHVIEYFQQISNNSELWDFVDKQKAEQLFINTKNSINYMDWRINRSTLSNLIILDRFLKMKG